MKKKPSGTGIVKIAKVLTFIVVFLSVMFGGVLLRHRIFYRDVYAKLSQKTDTISYKVKWMGVKYEGTYEGEVKSQKPHGEGTFTSADDAFSYTGEWSKGVFNGNGVITYTNGQREEGIYYKGKRNGFCRIYTAEDSWLDSLYEKNWPYGVSLTTENGKITEKKFIVNGLFAEELKEQALPLTKKLVQDKEYLGNYIKISGKVEYVEEDKEKCYFRINADGLGMVTGSYEDTYEKGVKQAYIPNMKIGNEVCLYGFYNGFYKNRIENDSAFYGYSCLDITPLYGELLSRKSKENTYSDIADNPYAYYGTGADMEFVVEKCLRQGKEFYIQAYPLTDNNEHHLYYLHITGKSDDIYYTGEKLSIHGYFAGQFKESHVPNGELTEEEPDELYAKYPLIKVLKCEDM